MLILPEGYTFPIECNLNRIIPIVGPNRGPIQRLLSQ